MNTDYTLSDSYVAVGGDGNFIPRVVDDFARKWVGGHYLVVFAILIVLIILVIWLLVWKVEGFNPTATLRMQKRDGLGETMDGDRSKSAFAQQVQSGGPSFAVDSAAAPGQPGSLGWQVLHSKDYDCAGRQNIGDDAWSWMTGVSKEEFSSKDKPKTDNDFSRVLSGHA